MTMDHCSEGHLVAEELAKEGFPAIVGPDLTSRNKIEVQNMSFKTAGVLNRAGVMVAITTDHPVSQIQTLPLCAGLAVKAGLPMEEGFGPSPFILRKSVAWQTALAAWKWGKMQTLPFSTEILWKFSHEPFILLSTGRSCTVMSPGNDRRNILRYSRKVQDPVPAITI